MASEVRKLAQRSASAAKEIKFKRVTDIMADIASATQEQDTGIEQVNRTIIEMDTVIQQNAALVEQAAAAAESLQDQAGSLAQLVSVFKLDGDRQPQPQRLAAQAGRSAKSTRPALV